MPTLKNFIIKLAPQIVLDLYKLKRHSFPRKCPICGFSGNFKNSFGPTLVRDNVCAGCGSVSRHRLYWLWLNGDLSKVREPILHFAAEKVFVNRFRENYQNYQTSDLIQDADLKLDIEDTMLPPDSYETVICNHVLEHVDDEKALSEIFRILRSGGRLICSVPIIEGWEDTYENKEILSDTDRERHFDQADHVRFYGRDFRDRLKAAGFKEIKEFTARGEESVKYGLVRGEKIFICSK